MSLLEKVFGCCERDKTYKKSDVSLNQFKSEKESNLVYLASTKNSQMNLQSFSNISPSLILSYSSKVNNIDSIDKNM